MKTFCNPVNIYCRFAAAGRGEIQPFRESADPAVVYWRGKYWLFPSKTGGCHWSTDMVEWHYVRCDDLLPEAYAPAAWIQNGELWFTTGWNSDADPERNGMFRGVDPEHGKWECRGIPVNMRGQSAHDPAVMQDDDGKIYFYHGCSAGGPLSGAEWDAESNTIKGAWHEFCHIDPGKRGWERAGENNSPLPEENALLADVWRAQRRKGPDAPYVTPATWNEGAWITKYNGKYYMQNSLPGTEYNVYADGISVGDSPLGPFKLQADNPFSLKPGGFITGAGHSCTFEDASGNFFHASTMRISVNHTYERRVGFFPVGFHEDGTMYCVQRFGDYPCLVPEKAGADPRKLFAGWTLQSWDAGVEVSSAEPGHEAGNVTDENIRTFWAAASGDAVPRLTLDLHTPCTVQAIQVNFADHHCTRHVFEGPGGAQKFLLEVSADGTDWSVFADQRENTEDRVHAYFQAAYSGIRYVRLTIFAVPAGGVPAVSGLRVFGTAELPCPARPERPVVERDPADPCCMKIRWHKPEHAHGVNILWGLSPDRMTHCWQVMENAPEEKVIRSLAADQKYYVAVEAFGRGGVSPVSECVLV